MDGKFKLPSSDGEKLSLKALMGDLASGRHYGIFIDDTGSPGAEATESGPHPERASWVAVVIPPSQMPEVLHQMRGAIQVLKKFAGASEFHCKDVFQGRGQFKSMKIPLRLNILAFLADIFSTYEFPIFVQTFDPVTLAAIHKAWRDSNPSEPGLQDQKIGASDFSKPKDAALFFLLFGIHQHLVAKRLSPDHLARVFIDEGFQKAGRALEHPAWREVFADGLICFMSSSIVLPLQLADFAAYAMNRQQILLAREKLSPVDRALMGILTQASLQFQNIPTVRVKIDEEGKWDLGIPH